MTMYHRALAVWCQDFLPDKHEPEKLIMDEFWRVWIGGVVFQPYSRQLGLYVPRRTSSLSHSLGRDHVSVTRRRFSSALPN